VPHRPVMRTISPPVCQSITVCLSACAGQNTDRSF
jgi:hypothetical protein